MYRTPLIIFAIALLVAIFELMPTFATFADGTGP
jgi:hypothetical protein